MNFKRWNYKCAYYYCYQILLSEQEQHFTFVRMDDLPALLPNATPLES
jgi:hypothetical protein